MKTICHYFFHTSSTFSLAYSKRQVKVFWKILKKQQKSVFPHLSVHFSIFSFFFFQFFFSSFRIAIINKKIQIYVDYVNWMYVTIANVVNPNCRIIHISHCEFLCTTTIHSFQFLSMDFKVVWYPSKIKVLKEFKFAFEFRIIYHYKKNH